MCLCMCVCVYIYAALFGIRNFSISGCSSTSDNTRHVKTSARKIGVLLEIRAARGIASFPFKEASVLDSWLHLCTPVTSPVCYKPTCWLGRRYLTWKTSVRNLLEQLSIRRVWKAVAEISEPPVPCRSFSVRLASQP